jgi:hypothetical protein
MSSGRVEPTGQRRHPPWCGAINETASVLCSYRMLGRLHSDRHTGHVDHRDGFAFVRFSVGKRRALATRHRHRDGERSACARPDPLRLTRATERYGTDYRRVPGIDCCAMRAKSPMTFCIDENAGAPDAMTPCIALTRFCACFMSGIIAMTAFASLAPGTPAI